MIITILKRLWERDKRIRQAFLDGPDWTVSPGYVNVGAYRSRTMLVVWWVLAFAARFATFPGRMLVATFCFVLLCVPLAVNTPVRLLALALFTFLAVDLALGFLWRPRLSITRRLPERVGAGGELTVEYVVTNMSRRSAWSLVFDSSQPPRGIEWGDGPATLPFLASGMTATTRAALKAMRRGRYRIAPVMASSSFPFGVFQWTRRKNSTAQALIVHPAFQPLRHLSLPVGRRFQRHGNTMVSKVGESPDFSGCRDFRSGDDPRRIHWPSSARHGELVVKEFQEEYLPRIAVVLDTFVPRKPFAKSLFRRTDGVIPELEAAISLTASLADYLARGDYIVDIFAAGPEVHHFQTGRSLGHFENMMDILASLEASRIEPIKELSPLVLEDIADIGCAAVILIHWSEAVAEFVAELRRSGTAVKLIMVSDSETNEAPDGDMTTLSSSALLDGRMGSL